MFYLTLNSISNANILVRILDLISSFKIKKKLRNKWVPLDINHNEIQKNRILYIFESQWVFIQKIFQKWMTSYSTLTMNKNMQKNTSKENELFLWKRRQEAEKNCCIETCFLVFYYFLFSLPNLLIVNWIVLEITEFEDIFN